MPNEIEVPVLGEGDNIPAHVIDPDLPGKLAIEIGTGRHAQATIVWLTVKWSFLAASIISSAFALRWCISCICNSAVDGNHLLDEIKGTWAIFTPLITLALGYLFGKGKQ